MWILNNKNKSSFLIAFAFIISLSSIELKAGDFEVHDYTIPCTCYPNDFYTNYNAIEVTDIAGTYEVYEFRIVELGGDLNVSSALIDIENGDWFWDPYHKGLGATELTDGISEKIGLKVTVAKNNIAPPGAYRNYKLQYKVKDINHNWSDWIDTEVFTVSVAEVPITTNTPGVVCTTSRPYSISPPTGYSSSWSFSPSSMVTSSSGSGTSASLTGSCNGIGDGTLTFTMTKASCPTLTTSRTIMVNGPNHADLEMKAYYTNGNPAPKGGSTYLLCPNTHYHIYLDNDISYSCGVSNLTWTIPAGWTKNYQSSNMISIYTNSSPGGQVIVKGQTCCSGCGSNMSLLTGYFGTYYSCGGYYMASPNPGSEYIDIDFTPEAAEMKSTSSSLDLEIRLVDKMGTVISIENVNSFPHRINASKLPEGNYIVLVRDKKVNSKTYDSVKILIEH